ncbi:SH3 domain-containing protein [Jannaschia seohaensis]|uniref:SH3 domain-containing protein n=1 Tax=Jannaschia seohaensis TaxID=475081 RepID=A0A2Y9B643_9RHOB|nr:SH3 domain-containing protein [Jannaschia seohaensis]PWJ12467.1 SH3 domain-containing protein [Jannaschia seohaensis]SSA50948.1 SH3 domain-containing protein [Jannaschia seohaensis]
MLRLLLCLFFFALPVAAQPVWNLGRVVAPLRSGPNDLAPVVGSLAPGAVAQITRCDVTGRWCLVSTDREVGWIDRDAAALHDGSPAAAVPPPPSISVTPLSEVPPPLPSAILDAVPEAELEQVPGARLPPILSLTAPMRNVTEGVVNLRAGPGTDRPIIGRLQPGEGGPIETCNPTGQWCLLRTPVGRGWVEMTLVGARRHVIEPR